MCKTKNVCDRTDLCIILEAHRPSSSAGGPRRTSGSNRTSSLYLSHSGDILRKSESSIRMKPPTCGLNLCGHKG